jgi:ABC-type lipoprotein export system ATPase subunit
MSSILKVEQLSKTFTSGQKDLTVLQDISFEVDAKAGISIVGPSGSGKTTLLGLCAGLDQPTAGKVSLVDIDLSGFFSPYAISGKTHHNKHNRGQYKKLLQNNHSPTSFSLKFER